MEVGHGGGGGGWGSVAPVYCHLGGMLRTQGSRSQSSTSKGGCPPSPSLCAVPRVGLVALIFFDVLWINQDKPCSSKPMICQEVDFTCLPGLGTRLTSIATEILKSPSLGGPVCCPFPCSLCSSFTPSPFPQARTEEEKARTCPGENMHSLLLIR